MKDPIHDLDTRVRHAKTGKTGWVTGAWWDGTIEISHGPGDPKPFVTVRLLQQKQWVAAPLTHSIRVIEGVAL